MNNDQSLSHTRCECKSSFNLDTKISKETNFSDLINPANKHVISVEAIWRTEIQEPCEKTGFPPSRE